MVLKHGVKRFLFWSTITFTLFTLLIAGSVGYILAEVPYESLNSFKEEAVESYVEFDAGALIKEAELRAYYQFSDEQTPYSIWMKNKTKLNHLEKIKNNQILIHNSFKLKELKLNHCQNIYCYQHRVPFNKIPSVFWKGLIGIEDHRFLEHFGVDFKSIARAIYTDIKAMKFVQGGSTLTQQLVKNLFYSNEKTLVRKIKEVIVAIYIESKFEKENILEGYFNEVFWGSLEGIRIKGLYAASLIYFDKRPEQVTPYEAAILISLLKGPNYYSPVKKVERLKSRVNVVFKKLVELRLFSVDGIKEWNDKKWLSWSDGLKNKQKNNIMKSIWWTSVETNSLISSYDQFVFKVKSEQLLDNINNRFPDKDIAVKVYMSKIGGEDLPYKYYSKFERKLENAIFQEKHQVGSTLKPILYYIYSSLGRDMNEKTSTEEIKLELKSGDWSPRESHIIKEKKVTLKDALKHSYNRPIIRIANEIGFNNLEKELMDYVPSLLTPLGEYPSQLLGAVELSVQELFDSYTKFINSECKEVREGKRKWEDTILYILSDPTTTTVRKIVGSKMKNMRFFGKTGTSNNGYDNWFIFFDGENLGVIWVGLEGKRDNKQLKLYGGTTAFKLYQSFSRDRGKRFNELSCEKFNKSQKGEY